MQPVAAAPASRQASTLALSGWRAWMLSDRTYHCMAARCGTMFGLSPPCVKMPCTRSVGRMCWRSAATLT